MNYSPRRFFPALFTATLLVAPACSSSSGATTPPPGGGSKSDAGGTTTKDASTDPVTTFTVQSSYATFSYEACLGDVDSGVIDDFGAVDGGTCMGESLGVFLTNNAELTCSATASGANNLDTPDTSSLGLVISTVGTTNQLVPGTYTLGSTVNAPILAQAIFTTTDGACSRSGPDVNGGSVTLTTITTSSAAGSYDVMFANGDTLKGSFSVTDCATATNPAALGAVTDAGACTKL